MNAVDINLLSQFNDLPFFSIPQNQRQKLFSHGKVRKVQSGERLIEEGTTEPILLILFEGVCQVRKLTPEHELSQFREITLRRTLAPAIFGEMSFLESRPHSSSVVAITSCVVWELTAEAFHRFMNGNINLGIALKRSFSYLIAQRLRETETALAAMLVHQDTVSLKCNDISFDDGSQS
ncbi:Crp/Fnr family transcriptional regulator [Scytonema sp. NUACC26]|uniref:Crp/Fnr family transcriptional regulator n=1 Tax=Scytonema sp. NUACC26 TaxID=3140176 RepID=UPI0034DB9C80